MAEKENTQAVVLQQPSDQQLVIKIEQDTDWISIGTIVLSLLAFVVTIYIVKKSTESQIQSNKDLIKSQNEIKKHELEFIYKSQEIDKFRNVIAEYFALLMKFNSVVSLEIGRMERGDLIESLINYLSQVAYYHMQIELFLDCESNSNHQTVKIQLKELMDSLLKIRIQLDDNKDQLNDRIAAFSNELDIVKASLIKLLNQNVKLQKGE
ncbi:hypothetical protein [Acinetobacter terrae]|uniref:hypothetical protein n=1 Tax=Acinetobacter terrae TaxID=2731247 RepID=UPI0007D87244|nr:hypothetical protein [Acinetobacter terrae]NNH14900.1 hypothetical protein [Acinetobacter terrae]OAL80218.1 hypothetical protein AY608_04895 [Acinetobacter terrae]